MAYDYGLWFNLGWIAAVWDGANATIPPGVTILEEAAFRHGFLYGCLPD